MDNRTLEKISSYLPVIIGTCDRRGWDGMNAYPVRPEAAVDVKTFFNLIQSQINIKELPYPEDIFGDTIGGITIVWETELDPELVTYDHFSVTFFGDQEIDYSGNLESIGTVIKRSTVLEEPLDREIIEHLIYFTKIDPGNKK